MRAGFIGLGAMGDPMARNWHGAGLLRGVWNRSGSKTTDFAAQTGCSAFPGPQALAADCDAVGLCVTSDDDVIEMARALLPTLRDGALVLDFSTVSPEAAREAAAIVAPSGAAFLDCPVTGGTEGARDGTLSILVGGDADAFARARPLLESVGRGITLIGPCGSGQAAKAINQIMIAGINQAVTEALALARAEDLPLDTLIEALGGGAAGSWFLTHRGPNMARGEYPLGFKVNLHQKDLEICREMANRHDVRLPIVEMTLVHYQRLLETAERSEDISSLFRLKSMLFQDDPQDLP